LGLDIAQAALQAATVAPASGLAERLRGIERVYTALDEIAGRLRRACPGHAIVFVAHPGRVFSREQLTRAVWGTLYDGTERTVDNFVARLRAHIGDDADHARWLETVRGVGYRFNG
jgi:DNA-binding response OmpR family regulator